MISASRRERDEFLRALEEARRAAMADDEDAPPAAEERASPEPPRSSEFLSALDRMAGRIKSYISTGLLARLYADGAARPAADSETETEAELHHAAAPELEPVPSPAPPKSEHEAVVDELHLTPGLSCEDLARIRREFAKINHPDRVLPTQRDEATRRMTIANSLIDEALRSKRGREH
jgi:hypothetical protein